VTTEFDPTPFDLEAAREAVRAAVRVAAYQSVASVEASHRPENIVLYCESIVEVHVAALIRAHGWQETVASLRRYAAAIEMLEESKAATKN